METTMYKDGVAKAVMTRDIALWEDRGWSKSPRDPEEVEAETTDHYPDPAPED